MRKAVNIVFAIGNLFWIPFVCWKVYGWFHGEVGFNLPELSYLNIFAIRIMLGLFDSNVGIVAILDEKPDKPESENSLKGLRNVFIFILFAVFLLADYLLKLILF